MIRVKDLQIYEDNKIKGNTALSNYEGGKLISQGFLLDNNNKVIATNNDGPNIPISDTLKRTKDKQPSIAKPKRPNQNASSSNANAV